MNISISIVAVSHNIKLLSFNSDFISTSHKREKCSAKYFNQLKSRSMISGSNSSSIDGNSTSCEESLF